MDKLQKQLWKASQSGFQLWMLNRVLQWNIPFNSPHNIKIVAINEEKVESLLPYKRKNLNHLRGLHACALAAVAEFTSGIALLQKLSSKEYRLIMKSLYAEYHYQAKSDVTAMVCLDQKWMEEKIIQPLHQSEKILVEIPIEIKDREGQLCATVTVNWQLKKWTAVKTK